LHACLLHAFLLHTWLLHARLNLAAASPSSVVSGSSSLEKRCDFVARADCQQALAE